MNPTDALFLTMDIQIILAIIYGAALLALWTTEYRRYCWIGVVCSLCLAVTQRFVHSDAKNPELLCLFLLHLTHTGFIARAPPDPSLFLCRACSPRIHDDFGKPRRIAGERATYGATRADFYSHKISVRLVGSFSNQFLHRAICPFASHWLRERFVRADFALIGCRSHIKH